MVLRACRATLRDRHAAEDAAQAVFLALARQAGAVGRSGSAAGWLFRVARRVSARAARRRVVPSIPIDDLDALPAPAAPELDADAELVVQEEVARLPDRYRGPVLLCFFEGLTHAEAARRLGVPTGTVAGRLARAKRTLADRLTRRGVSPAVLAPVAVAVGPSFVGATARAAAAFADRVLPTVPVCVLTLAERELRVTVLSKVCGAAAVALALAGACLGLSAGARDEPPAAVPPPRPAADKAAAPKPPAPVIGKTFALAPITTDLQRRLIHNGGPDSVALLVVDAGALFKDANTFDVAALQRAELKKGLKAFRRAGGKSVVHFQVQYTGLHDVSGDAKAVLDYTLAGAAQAEELVPGTRPGFHTYGNGKVDFAEYVAPLKDGAGTDVIETGVGDSRAVAYPVRTPLSRMMAGPVAGVVVTLTPIACRGDAWLPEDVDRSVRAALNELKLAKRSKVNFVLNVPDRDDQAQEKLRRTCKVWAEDAGLELWQFSY